MAHNNANLAESVPALTTLTKDAIVKMAIQQDFTGTMNLIARSTVRSCIRGMWTRYVPSTDSP